MSEIMIIVTQLITMVYAIAIICCLYDRLKKSTEDIDSLHKLLAMKDMMIKRQSKDNPTPPGTLVRLKNGGPIMITDGFYAPETKGNCWVASCVWVDAQGGFRREKIGTDALEIIKKEDLSNE